MRFKVIFNETDKKLRVSFKSCEKRFKTTFKNIQIATIRPDVEYYEGEYTFTPKVKAQIVPTAQKFLSDDMHIKAIPYYDVRNTSGGNTVYIGNEV